MLLKRRMPLPSLFLADTRPKREEADFAPITTDAGEIHPCGLRRRCGCGDWSLLALILWWALKNDGPR
jgi:hypothetical protein